MALQAVVFAALILSVAGFFLSMRRAWALGGGSRKPLHSLPTYHGFYTALWTLLPPLLVIGIFMAADGDNRLGRLQRHHHQQILIVLREGPRLITAEFQRTDKLFAHLQRNTEVGANAGISPGHRQR